MDDTVRHEEPKTKEVHRENLLREKRDMQRTKCNNYIREK